jgi:transposase
MPLKKINDAELENVLYQTPVTLWSLIEEMGLRATFAKHMKKKYGVQPADAACVMILNYATDRHTKNTFSSWYSQTWLPRFLNIPSAKMNKDLLCRTMDFFTEEKIEEIHSDVYKMVKQKFKLSDNLLLYDTTKISFEGDSCTLAKHGYNPNHLYAPQVSLAMPVTVEGFPASHKVFEGNTKDSKTLQKSIDLIEKAGVVQKTVFIFDRGVCSKPNFDFLESKGAQFICGFTKNARVKKTILALKPEQYASIDDDVSFHETIEGTRRMIIYHSKKLEEEQRTSREERINKISEKLRKLAATAGRYEKTRLHEKIGFVCGTYRKFFDVKTEQSFSFNVKQTVVDNAALVEGRYAILTTTLLGPKTVLERYRGRNFIEMCFKDLKMFVDIRPVRHWKDSRVLVHVFLAVLAFGVRSLVQLKLQRAGMKITSEDAINQLNKVRALAVNGKVLRLTGETDNTKKIAEIIAKNT